MAKGSRPTAGGSSKKNSGFAPISSSGLPELEGSVKQVAWAEDIRESVIENLNRRMTETMKAYDEEGPRSWKNESYLSRELLDEGLIGLVGRFMLPIGPDLSRAERAAKKAEMGSEKYAAWSHAETVRRQKEMYAEMWKRAREVIKTQKSASWWINHRP